MSDSAFAKNLRAIRVNSGKSVTEVSKFLISRGRKASEKTIYSWESGNSQPTPDTLLDMCEFYGVDDIMGAFGYKKSLGPDKSEPRDEFDREVISLFHSIRPAQRGLALSILKTVAAESQGKPVDVQVSTYEPAPKAERQISPK